MNSKLSVKCSIILLIFLAVATNSIGQSGAPMVVNTATVKATIQPTMWGIFFEDINMGADGGLYAELVKNRSFEFFRPLMGWTVHSKKEGAILVVNRKAVDTANPRYIKVTADPAVDTSLGMTNEGFRGMGIKKGVSYDFSVMYHQEVPGVSLQVELVDSAGKNLGSAALVPTETGAGWYKQAVHFTATETVPKAKLNIWFNGKGVIDLDIISLFPGDTWQHRRGGMRADMVQLLANMKPGFIRFPGGCIVEGFDLSQRYQWKKTIGPLEDRQLIINRWNFEFAHRPTPDYFQTFGLGFFEYFQLAEDIGAEPLPILNAGMACQFNSAEVVPVSELNPYVQDALDLVEFANGDIHTKWGKVRADMGHPQPFHLKMMGIGNENWGPQYIERLKVFTNAIKAKYPDLLLINSAGTDPGGERFEYLDSSLRNMHADIIDEHYYRRPEWFLSNAARYDNYPRNGSKVFAGEYAAQSDKTVSVYNKNNWQTALAEAAFMTGLERNADVVYMASYAPLFAHADAWQWTPDMIWVDNLRSYGTPNYYVQKLYATNRGTHVVPMLMNQQPVTGQDSLYATAAIDKKTNELIIKVVNAANRPVKKEINITGSKRVASTGKWTVLKSDDLTDANSFEQATAVSPVEQSIAVKQNKVSIPLDPYSFNVIRIKMQ